MVILNNVRIQILFKKNAVTRTHFTGTVFTRTVITVSRVSYISFYSKFSAVCVCQRL